MRRALVSDFDGTITENDFYTLIAERYMPKDAPDYFAEYRAGRITHFQAMQGFYHYAPTSPAALEQLLADTRPDPRLAESVARLEGAGWDLLIVSAGSSWYIDRILSAAGVRAVVHSNPGEIVEGRGLVMRLPRESRFFSEQVGVDKPAVVRDALDRYETVAFAGDGLPDVAPSLLVDPALRFAKGLLAEQLDARGEPYRRYACWSEVVDAVLGQ
jgi:2,3-diketo-5-methylthio-1-phosphopentane phosphatase